MNYLECMCSPYLVQNDTRRTEFFAKISHLLSQLINHAPIDAAADQVLANVMYTVNEQTHNFVHALCCRWVPPMSMTACHLV